MSATSKLRIERICKSFGGAAGSRPGPGGAGPLNVLEGVTFDIANHEFVAVIGPSGCGKSTLLKIVQGLIPHDSGSIYVDGRQVDRPSFDRALVFQNANLLPWRTAQKNVELGLEAKGEPKAQRAEVARTCLALVGLSGFEDYYPHQLSGGMQQRVGLARALAVEPEILLMDEPFGALDAQTRERLQQELLRIHETTRKTILFVTHDLDEAVYLAQRIVAFSTRPGRVAAIVDVNLPRPRPNPNVAKSLPAFVEARQQVWELLATGDLAAIPS